MAAAVQQYVPGYRLKQEVQFTPIPRREPVHTLLPPGADAVTTKVTVFLEVEGARTTCPPTQATSTS
jgi:acetaldehyde dehydrogenase